MAIFDIPSRLWTLVRKVEDLLSFQASMRESLEALDARLRALETKLIQFEAKQDQLITTAQAAANVAASAVASAVISDVVTRVTRIEMKHENLQGRLSAPSGSAEPS
jgi:phage shock protein A